MALECFKQAQHREELLWLSRSVQKSTLPRIGEVITIDEGSRHREGWPPLVHQLGLVLQLCLLLAESALARVGQGHGDESVRLSASERKGSAVEGLHEIG